MSALQHELAAVVAANGVLAETQEQLKALCDEDNKRFKRKVAQSLEVERVTAQQLEVQLALNNKELQGMLAAMILARAAIEPESGKPDTQALQVSSSNLAVKHNAQSHVYV